MTWRRHVRTARSPYCLGAGERCASAPQPRTSPTMTRRSSRSAPQRALSSSLANRIERREHCREAAARPTAACTPKPTSGTPLPLSAMEVVARQLLQLQFLRRSALLGMLEKAPARFGQDRLVSVPLHAFGLCEPDVIERLSRAGGHW
jgi:hypothetical protein